MSIKFLFPPTSREKLTPSIPFLALLHKFHREDGTTFLSISSLSLAIILVMPLKMNNSKP